RVDPTSLAKIYGVVTGSLMLLFALPAGCAIAVFGSLDSELGGLGAGIGLLLMILYPVVGAVAGFIGGFLYAIVYNLVAERVGGVQLEMDTWGVDPSTDF
ncbi:MAG: hypothetical protein AAGK21_16105, partial [Bacteroidota bacterium]